MLANRPANTVLRAWAPGCSTGEEAYLLAIVFKEALEKSNPKRGFSLQIFATDLDIDAIEAPEKACFLQVLPLMYRRSASSAFLCR